MLLLAFYLLISGGDIATTTQAATALLSAADADFAVVSHTHNHTAQTNTQSSVSALSCWPVLSRLYGPRGVYLIFPRLIARRVKSFSSLLVFLYARCTCSQKWARPESLSCPTPFLPLPSSLSLSLPPFALSQNSLNKILHKVS